MIKRRKTKTITVGPIKLGHQSPIAVQTMTKVFTTNVNACLQQIHKLNEAGCDLVRIAVPTKADTEALAKIIAKSPIPVIADIHFSAARAIEAIEAVADRVVIMHRGAIFVDSPLAEVKGSYCSVELQFESPPEAPPWGRGRRSACE